MASFELYITYMLLRELPISTALRCLPNDTGRDTYLLLTYVRKFQIVMRTDAAMFLEILEIRMVTATKACGHKHELELIVVIIS